MLAEAFRSTDSGAQWNALSVAGEMDNSAQLAPASDTTAVIKQAEGPGAADRRRRCHLAHGLPLGDGAWWSWTGFTDSNTGSALRSRQRPGQLAVAERSEPGAALAQH